MSNDCPPVRATSLRIRTDDESSDVQVIADLEDASVVQLVLNTEQVAELVSKLLYVSRLQRDRHETATTLASPPKAIPIPIDNLSAEQLESGDVVLWLKTGPIHLAPTVDLDALVGLCEWVTTILGGSPHREPGTSIQ